MARTVHDNSWIAKPKLGGFPLTFRRFFENSCVTGTHQVIWKKVANFAN